MALTNQPYLPLYIQDWLSNNKLKQCLLGSHGLMINVMCLMHKEDTYGKLLLKQKFKQTDKPEKNFALMLAKLLPFELADIEHSLSELLEEKILIIHDDILICKRMVKDAEISAERSKNGKKGGAKNKESNLDFAYAKGEAKPQANTESEYEYENKKIKPNENSLIIKMVEIFKTHNSSIQITPSTHYPPCLQIAYRIAKIKNWSNADVLNGKMNETLKSWESIVVFIKSDEWLCTRSLMDLNSDKEWDRLVLKMAKPKAIDKNDPKHVKIKPL